MYSCYFDMKNDFETKQLENCNEINGDDDDKK